MEGSLSNVTAAVQLESISNRCAVVIPCKLIKTPTKVSYTKYLSIAFRNREA